MHDDGNNPKSLTIGDRGKSRNASESGRTHVQSLFQRIKARRGAKKAIIAVAASMLTAMYHMLKNRVPYKELGLQHFDQRNRTETAHRLVRRLQQMGYAIELAAQPA